jgi:hypothetical protein
MFFSSFFRCGCRCGVIVVDGIGVVLVLAVVVLVVVVVVLLLWLLLLWLFLLWVVVAAVVAVFSFCFFYC